MTQFAHDSVLPDKQSSLSKKEQVENMFNNISGTYDFLNKFLSLGIDRRWRKKALMQLASLKPHALLDVATGTGDMAIQAVKLLHPISVTGIDLSEKMLELGKQKVKKEGFNNQIELLKGDSETILFSQYSFDAVTVAFGVRNFEHLEQGLSEIYRVLKPGGKLVVLEFSKPTSWLIKPFYFTYLKLFCPLAGRFFSKDKTAYQYLNQSINKFPEGKNFTRILDHLGFKNSYLIKLSLGICTIYCGEK